MKKILILFCLCCCVRAAVAGALCGPGRTKYVENGDTCTTFSPNAAGVPIAYFAMGTACNYGPDYGPLETTNPMELCATLDFVGQAACTDHAWSAQDMDVDAVNAGGYCWCRRTHVRVNGELASDTGPWYLLSTYDDALSCSDTYACAAGCRSKVVDGHCNAGAMSITMLPAY